MDSPLWWGTPRCAEAASSRSRSRSSGRIRIPPRPGACAPRRSASGGCARRATATWRRRPSPGSRCGGRRGGPGRSSRRSSTATTRRSTSSSSTSKTCVSDQGGTTASSASGSSACARSTAASTSRRPTSQVTLCHLARGAFLITCCSLPDTLRSHSRRSSRTIRAPCTRTGRTSTATRSKSSARAWRLRRNG